VLPVATEDVTAAVVTPPQALERRLPQQNRATRPQGSRELSRGSSIVLNATQDGDVDDDVEALVGERDGGQRGECGLHHRSSRAHVVQRFVGAVGADDLAVTREPGSVATRAASGVQQTLIAAQPGLKKIVHDRAGIRVPPVVVLRGGNPLVVFRFHSRYPFTTQARTARNPG
jgi:hypothetical protein